MTTQDTITCDGLGCIAETRPRHRDDGWMTVNVQELTANSVHVRRADLCPVHGQAFLDMCGPLPRQA